MIETPRKLGFRMPAEWEPHQATWIGWPHNVTDWPQKFAPIPWVYGEIVRKLTDGENVRVLANSKAHQTGAKRVLTKAHVDLSKVEFFTVSTNRGWTRDFGPVFVRSQKEKAIVQFGFNAWAKYSDYKKDARVATSIAKKLKLRIFSAAIGDRAFVLEGGSIDVNGRGTLLTTEECLLDPAVQTRNPRLSKEEIEQNLRDTLGVDNILWFGKGIAGDDTHGHIDDLCRFVNPRTLVLAREENQRDDNYRPLEENWERAKSMRLEDGSKPEIIPLPMPSPLWFNKTRLPASYANFYMANAAVLVPTFNDPKDRLALGILGEVIKDRPVIGIHAVDLVWGLGTLHCLTHEEPE